jgi:fructan beta-fructosidase
VDHGRDFYASQSFSDLPEGDGRRIWMGWPVTGSTPAWSPRRRGADAVGPPRGPPRPGRRRRRWRARIREVEALRGKASFAEPGEIVGRRNLFIAGDVFDIEAVLRFGAAKAFGLAVRVGDGEETLVGYDVAASRFFVDRTRSGRSDFHSVFAGRHSGFLALVGGFFRLRVFVDRFSVEVFGGDGRTVISDRVYPAADEPRYRPVRRRRHGRPRVAAGVAAGGGDRALSGTSALIR